MARAPHKRANLSIKPQTYNLEQAVFFNPLLATKLQQGAKLWRKLPAAPITLLPCARAPEVIGFGGPQPQG